MGTMQNNHSQSSLDPQAQRSGGKPFLPISKYYYGPPAPGQTWGITEKSPVYESKS